MYSNNLVCDLLEYINNNLLKEITIDELSNYFFFDKTYIMKKFKKEIGVTIHSYINIMKIYRSLDFFDTDNSILNIGLVSGFNSLEYFSETFKKIIGVSPNEYKKFKNNNYLNFNNSDKIISSIIKLKELKDFSNKYIENRKKTSNYIKTIFK